MFYYLFEYLDQQYDIPGAGVFQYISFRSGMAVIFSLLISMIFGKRIIAFLKKMQVGETVRNLGLDGQMKKQGTPTMGGLIMIAAIVIPTLFFARLDNIYIILMLVSTLWLGAIGFLDDYIKVFRKDKKGLHGKFKIMGQVTLGIIVGATLYFHPGVVIREKSPQPLEFTTADEILIIDRDPGQAASPFAVESVKSTKTTIPFLKDNELDYSRILRFMGEGYEKWTWLVFIPIVVLIITAVSNGANMTDGLMGWPRVPRQSSEWPLGCWLTCQANVIFSDYLNIMYIPFTGEMVVFIAAFVGACIGFLWYNSYPCPGFHGRHGEFVAGRHHCSICDHYPQRAIDTGYVRDIFRIESLSVMLQVFWFKYTKRRFGEGRSIFKMAPLHHHYQMLGYHEAKIVQSFLIVGILLADIFNHNTKSKVSMPGTVDIAILGAGESGTGAAILARKKGFNVWVSDKGLIHQEI
jgi:phospho-N-acetylmuramoyl-pentapeptide-transferase